MLARHPLKVSIGVAIFLVLLLAALDRWLKWPRSDTLGVQQLVIAVLLVPTAIYGFLVTTAAFASTQAAPVLDLSLEVAPGKYEKSTTVVAASVLTRRTPAIVLTNTGNAVAVWYLIRIERPQLPDKEYPRTWASIGSESNWKIPAPDDTRSADPILFLSNGEFACYPGVPFRLIVMDFNFFNWHPYTHPIDIPYTIATDKGPPVHGNLRITVTVVNETTGKPSNETTGK